MTIRTLSVLGVMLEPRPKTLSKNLMMSRLLPMEFLVMEILLTLLILLILLALPTPPTLILLMILVRRSHLQTMKSQTMKICLSSPGELGDCDGESHDSYEALRAWNKKSGI